MKSQFLKLVLGSVVAITLSTSCVFAEDISVFVNYEPMKFEVPPIIEEGRTLVPLEGVFERLGATVEWNENTQEIMVQKAFSDITLQVGNKEMRVNDNLVNLDVAPQIKENRTLIPLRAIAEALKSEVRWDEENRVVFIKNKDKSTVNGDWLEIRELKSEIILKTNDGEKDFAIISASVPQIVNPEKDSAIEKINDYYKELGTDMISDTEDFFKAELLSEAEELMSYAWLPYTYQLSYDIGYNANNILSVFRTLFMDTGGAHPNTVIQCDIFDVTTGEKLNAEDILNYSEEEVKEFIIAGFDKMIDEDPAMFFETAKEDIRKYIDEVRVYIDNNKLVFITDRYLISPYVAGTPKFEVDMKKNSELFRRDLTDIVNHKEQEDAQLKAQEYYRDTEVFFKDLATFNGDECYVFESTEQGNESLIAVERNGERVYFVEEAGGYYRVNDVKNNLPITNREALNLVAKKIDSTKYTYEIGEVFYEDDKEYVLVVFQDMEENTIKSIGVDRQTGDLYIYYFE